MPRSKPFSGKQKKEQLKARRAKKQELQSGVHANNADEHESDAVGPSGIPKQLLEDSLGKSNQFNRLSTVFVKETKEEVEARRIASALPLDLSKRGQSLHARLRLNSDPVLDHPKGVLLRQGHRGRLVYTSEGAQTIENDEFHRWLETIYSRYRRADLNTFEHNVGVWMQLWHTLATADVIAIVADIRNPLWHIPESLYNQVVQELKKPLIIVLNKIDLVPQAAVTAWVAYLKGKYPAAVVVPFTASGADLYGQPAETLAMRRRLLKAARQLFDEAHVGRRIASATGLLRGAGSPESAVSEVETRLRSTIRVGHRREDLVLSVDAHNWNSKRGNGRAVSSAAPDAEDDDGSVDGGDDDAAAPALDSVEEAEAEEEEEDEDEAGRSDDEDDDDDAGLEVAAGPAADDEVVQDESSDNASDDDGSDAEAAVSKGRHGASDAGEAAASASSGLAARAAAAQRAPSTTQFAPRGADAGRQQKGNGRRGGKGQRNHDSDDNGGASGSSSGDGLDRFAGRPRRYKRGDASKKILEIEAGFRGIQGNSTGGKARNAVSFADDNSEPDADGGAGGGGGRRKGKGKGKGGAKSGRQPAGKAAAGSGKAAATTVSDSEGDEDDGGLAGAAAGPPEKVLAAAEAAGTASSGSSGPAAASAASSRPPYVKPLTIGMVGHPNVGKSSVINCLCGEKKVSVSRTAGHTKRAQTIHLVLGSKDSSANGAGDGDTQGAVDLLDCPGLVFPHAMVPEPPASATSTPASGRAGDGTAAAAAVSAALAASPIVMPGVKTIRPQVDPAIAVAAASRAGGDHDERAMQECCGVIPLAQVREPYTSIRFVATHLPLERLYGLSLPKDEDEWTALNLCEALAIKRGYYIARTGRPDSHAAGREMLYDCQDGIVPLYWLPPKDQSSS